MQEAIIHIDVVEPNSHKYPERDGKSEKYRRKLRYSPKGT